MKVKYGVPQGSIQPNSVICRGCKIQLDINSVNDCVKLQSDVDVLCNLCTANGMNLNITSVKILNVTQPSKPYLFKYCLLFIHGYCLETANEISDLGIVIDHRIS